MSMIFIVCDMVDLAYPFRSSFMFVAEIPVAEEASLYCSSRSEVAVFRRIAGSHLITDKTRKTHICRKLSKDYGDFSVGN